MAGEPDVTGLLADDVISLPLMSMEVLTSKLPSESTLPPEARADSVSDVSRQSKPGGKWEEEYTKAEEEEISLEVFPYYQNKNVIYYNDISDAQK